MSTFLKNIEQSGSTTSFSVHSDRIKQQQQKQTNKELLLNNYKLSQKKSGAEHARRVRFSL